MTQTPLSCLIRHYADAPYVYMVIAVKPLGNYDETYRYIKQALVGAKPRGIIHEAVGCKDYCIACFEARKVLTKDEYDACTQRNNQS